MVIIWQASDTHLFVQSFRIWYRRIIISLSLQKVGKTNRQNERVYVVYFDLQNVFHCQLLSAFFIRQIATQNTIC